MTDTILDEMKASINEWFDYIGDKDVEGIAKRTSLQVGIHDYAQLEYAKGKISVTDSELDFMSPKVKNRQGESAELLSEEQVREQIKSIFCGVEWISFELSPPQQKERSSNCYQGFYRLQLANPAAKNWIYIVKLARRGGAPSNAEQLGMLYERTKKFNDKFQPVKEEESWMPIIKI
ncbi:DUF6138 family protein [Paenibacillus sp. MER TA 81-3]|uniref:DUF6138 family protein n=1 Tax=Paenibacillus sp. MER TA 81-3 TaxID=2939573 RepID=UPI00203F2A47|nr:DUF6138 family protein [Paenibacillus sp. MER TA 81-3]MCM3342565.1 DUF6138 family protein [Paenibacillus sp. MER TA 81-3]